MCYLKSPIYLTLYDFEQVFDSLWLQDSICSLWDEGIRNEFLPLIYRLNERVAVSVNTPHGRATEFNKEDVVKQGTVLGSNICSTSTAEYCDQNSGVPVGNIMVGPLAYVDDLTKINIIRDEVYISHAKSLAFSKLKKLKFNKKKCYGIVINGKKDEGFPEISVEDHTIEEMAEVVYLGDIIN